MRAKQRAGISFIRAHPRAFLGLVGRRVLDTWTAWYDSRIDKWIRVLHLSRAAVASCAIFSTLSLAGLLLALRRNIVPVLPVALCVVLFPIPYYITHTTLRYRHPIDPLLLLLAAYLVDRIARQVIRGSQPVDSTPLLAGPAHKVFLVLAASAPKTNLPCMNSARAYRRHAQPSIWREICGTNQRFFFFARDILSAAKWRKALCER